MDLNVRFHNTGVWQRGFPRSVAEITGACDGCHVLTVPGSQIPRKMPAQSRQIAPGAFMEESDEAHCSYSAT